MAVIASTLKTVGHRVVTETTMTSSDTLVYQPDTGQILILRNATAGGLTVTLTGSASVSASFPGVPFVATSGGFSTGSIAAGALRAIPLDTIGEFLKGTVTLTGGTGIVASLLNPL
jgi:hypothetical protein